MSHHLPVLNNEDTFEDAICDLFNKLGTTITFKRFGKRGSKQKGIDIFSVEKDVAIQCKKKDLTRRDIAIKKELLDDIERDVKKIVDENLGIRISKLYIVSTYKDHTEIDEYCEELKERYHTDFDILYWGWDTIEKKMIDQRSILEKYWPAFIISENSAETALKKNLALKKEIEKDFSAWLDYPVEKRKIRSRMLLRAHDGNQYPDTNEPDNFGEYSWFRADIKKLYHKGIEFVIGMAKSIAVFEDNSWTFSEVEIGENSRLVKVVPVGQINFADIVDYDMSGDEFYAFPHFYCRFKYMGLPFENTYYYDTDREWETYETKDKRP